MIKMCLKYLSGRTTGPSILRIGTEMSHSLRDCPELSVWLSGEQTARGGQPYVTPPLHTFAKQRQTLYPK